MDLDIYTSQDTLERIAKYCPEAMIAYFRCLRMADYTGKVKFTKKQVVEQMCFSWASFRNHIKKLALEGLLIWQPEDDCVSVEIVREDAR